MAGHVFKNKISIVMCCSNLSREVRRDFFAGEKEKTMQQSRPFDGGKNIAALCTFVPFSQTLPFFMISSSVEEKKMKMKKKKKEKEKKKRSVIKIKISNAKKYHTAYSIQQLLAHMAWH